LPTLISLSGKVSDKENDIDGAARDSFQEIGGRSAPQLVATREPSYVDIRSRL
jgi:hypothetical protein